MSLLDLMPAKLGLLVALVGLVVWRRAIKAPPRWLAVVVGLLQAGIVAGVAFTYFGLRDVDRAITSDDAGNKASTLATGISHSMWGIVAAAACFVAAVIVLAIATWRSRGVGADDLPAANVHNSD